jgi:polyketide biosynthesis enoyl-CoA hydratase PksH
VAGGGVGLVAAADLVLATERSTFALPEALWGLLPCCVLPFLIRRTGFQRAYAMTLTTRPVGAAEAAGYGLVDDLGADLRALSRRLALRVSKVDRSTVADLKQYAHRLCPLPDGTRELAIGELSRLMGRPVVQDRLSAFAASGRYPWER